MQRLISLFEHESVQFDWTDGDVAVLDRLNRNTGADVLRAGIVGQQRVVRASSFVGVIRLGHRTVQILPKAFRGDAAPVEQARQATGNLLIMLEAAGKLPVREHELVSLLKHDVNWFELLTRLFAAHLLEEWERGAFRTYQGRDDELPVLRGAWRVGDQLRRPERKHLLAVTYDEFSADNPLNRLLRFVVERLWRHTGDHDNRRRLGELREWMDEVPVPPAFPLAEADAIVLTRLNQRYQPLLNLAKLFLRASSLQTAHGSVETFAFVFDMNRLFEQFVTRTIVRRLRHVYEPLGWLPRPQSARRALLTDESGRQRFWLRPDLLFEDAAGRTVLVLDTKYKRPDLADPQAGVAEADAYQMYAYARRYDCPRVVLLYPASLTVDSSTEGPTPRVRRFATPCSVPGVAEPGPWLEVRTVNLGRDLNLPSERNSLRDELGAMLVGQ
jgi:5-methylcytosine-specific restriction enzyme subunit McrC